MARPDSPQRREIRTVHLRRPADGLERHALVETDRAVEFEPLKNATGPDSPATVRQRMSDQFADWLEAAGARRSSAGHDGSVPFGIEISPLYALDAAELKSKLEPGLVVEGPLLLK